MNECETDRPPLPGAWLFAPILALLLMALGAMGFALLYFPGKVIPCLNQTARLQHSALFRYHLLKDMVARGIVWKKIRCVIVSETFRWSPRLAGFFYHHLGKLTLSVTLAALGLFLLCTGE